MVSGWVRRKIISKICFSRTQIDFLFKRLRVSDVTLKFCPDLFMYYNFFYISELKPFVVKSQNNKEKKRCYVVAKVL